MTRKKIKLDLEMKAKVEKEVQKSFKALDELSKSLRGKSVARPYRYPTDEVLHDQLITGHLCYGVELMQGEWLVVRCMELATKGKRPVPVGVRRLFRRIWCRRIFDRK